MNWTDKFIIKNREDEIKPIKISEIKTKKDTSKRDKALEEKTIFTERIMDKVENMLENYGPND